MKRTPRSTPRPVLHLTWAALLGVPVVAVPALAQDAAAPATEPERMEKVIVTGSNIPTAETVGVAPVDTISSEAIQSTGGQDVLEVLKRLTPVFAGNGNTGQSVNNGGGGEAYVAIRNLPTLVLVDGRRLANSAFSSGALVDLNTIPLAMIERIEVLKDGASTVYGSQAIGGVVNIITRKNFTGVEIGGRYGVATGDSNASEYSAYVVAGTSTEKTSITVGGSYYHMDPLLSTDTETAGLDAFEALEKNIYPPSHLSPSFPGRVQAGGVSYILAGSPLAAGHPDHNPAVTKPPVVSGGPFTGSQAVLNYNDAVFNQLGYRPYIPIKNTPIGQRFTVAIAPTGLTGEQAAWPLLNTPEFGTYSMQSQDRIQAFGNATHDIFDERLQIFGDFMFANTESEGVLAPSPVSSLGTANIVVPSEDPNNPFGIALGPGGAATPRVRHRFVDSGNRVFASQNDTYRFVAGLKGAFDSGWSYEAAYNYGRNDQIQYTRNAVNGAALDLALTPNASDPSLSSLKDASGNYVPFYNVFALSGAQDPATVDAIRTTLFQTGVSEFSGMDGVLVGAPVDLPAGKLGLAFGGGTYGESLQLDVDGLTKIGKVPGLNPAGPTPGGTRENWSVFGEVRVPIFSADFDLPGFHQLELTGSFRHENFDPGGESTVPKVGIRWQPIDHQITLRGGYSEGFIAPTVYQLFGGPQVSFPQVTGADGALGQAQYVYRSTAALEASDSEQYGGGIVVSPDAVKGLTLSFDYYHIQTRNDVFRAGDQFVMNDLNALGAASAFAAGFVFDDGTRLTTNDPDQVTISNWGSVDVPLFNGSEQMTQGFDVTGVYELAADSAGKFTFWASANILIDYTYSDPFVGGPFHYDGQFTDGGPAAGAQGMLPDFIVNTGVTWDYKNLSLTVNARYVPPVDDFGTLHESNGDYGWNDFTVDGTKWEIEDYYRVDLQVAYEVGRTKLEKSWYDGTRVALGVNNITDEAPRLISSSFEDLTDKSTYDAIGRFFYVEVRKQF